MRSSLARAHGRRLYSSWLPPLRGAVRTHDVAKRFGGTVSNVQSQELVTRVTNVKLARDGAVEESDLVFRSGRILEARSAEHARADVTLDGRGSLIVPGFIDLQLNGAFGADFSSPSLTQADVVKVAQGILAHGVTSFLPTVITSAADVYAAVLPKLTPQAGGVQGAEILGVHCEGPFIDKVKRGTHPEEFVQDGFPRGFESLVETYGQHHIANGTIKVVTLAPELVGAQDAIAGLVKAGVTVSVGHTAAATKEALAGVSHGASLITHMFNAMPAFHHRDPGVIGLLTMDDPLKRVHYGIIADGLHVHPMVLKHAFMTHADGCVLVTDSMSALGLGCGTHRLGNVEVVVEEVKSMDEITNVLRARKTGTDTLAGAVVDMHSCFTNLMAFTGCDVIAASECASTNPAKALGITHKGRLSAGCDADFLLLDPTTFALRETWVGGTCAYASEPGSA